MVCKTIANVPGEVIHVIKIVASVSRPMGEQSDEYNSQSSLWTLKSPRTLA